MQKKIVAIGGGMIGEVKTDGTKYPYETYLFDKEIVLLSGKKQPNILFIGLADINYSNEYFGYFRNIYENVFSCNCKHLSVDILSNTLKVNELFKWTDIIYVGGGNTYTLMNYLMQYNIDSRLYDSYNQGKVMCGISAGAMCWFQYGNSIIPDVVKKSGKIDLIKQKCLGFENLVFVPHCDEINGHFENVQNLLLNEKMVAISLSNCSCFEIVDNKYRILGEENNMYGISPFAIKSYWLNNEYHIENIDINENFELLDNLLEIKNSERNISDNVKKLLKRRKLM